MIIQTIEMPKKRKLEKMKRDYKDKPFLIRIKAVDCVDYLQALEGSHRLQLANDLNLQVSLEIYNKDDFVDTDKLANKDYKGKRRAGELAGDMFDNNAHTYSYDFETERVEQLPHY